MGKNVRIPECLKLLRQCIEWSKRIVWLEPVQEGDKARWMGRARLHRWEE